MHNVKQQGSFEYSPRLIAKGASDSRGSLAKDRYPLEYDIFRGVRWRGLIMPRSSEVILLISQWPL